MQKNIRGVADTHQTWIPGKLIRDLEHPRSGAVESDDMGGTWVPTDKDVGEPASRFDTLMVFNVLRLGRRLGTEVTPLLSRKETAAALRGQSLVASLVSPRPLTGRIHIDGTVGPLVSEVDLRAVQVTATSTSGHFETRPSTRVNWLARHLKDFPDSVRVAAFEAHGRSSAAELVRRVAANSRGTRGSGRADHRR
jgi:hypothetical protein